MVWGFSKAPLKHSQSALDGFDNWRAEQALAVAQRGADSDPAKEEEHNQFMIRQNLNAYICYNELDTYTACLQAHNLIHHEEDGHVETNVANKANEKFCRKSFGSYTQCMSSKTNQEAILQNASVHPSCADQRDQMLQCMSQNSAVEVSTNEPQCISLYHTLIRCGLNHQWDHYWRSLTKFTDADEYHLFELSRDDNKKQELMRLTNSTRQQQQQYAKHREDLQKGYYTNPHNRSS